MSISLYVAFYITVYLLFGAIWYTIDRRYCLGIYRRWYKLTHKDPLPEGEERGFIYKQPAKTRLTWAAIISTFQSLMELIYGTHLNPLVELFMWFAEVPITMFGFYLGRYVYMWWMRKEAFFETIDRFESGETNVSEKIADAVKEKGLEFRKKGKELKEGVGHIVEQIIHPDEEEEAPPEKTEPPPEEEEPEIVDPREAVDRYKKGRT